MEVHENVLTTQENLCHEGDRFGELLSYLRNSISPLIVGESQWQRMTDCAQEYPSTVGAHPFGFTVPLLEATPNANLSITVAAGTRSGDHFEQLDPSESSLCIAQSVACLCRKIKAAGSRLNAVTGHKIMIEHDFCTPQNSLASLPGIFLRPREYPFSYLDDPFEAINSVASELYTCVEWDWNDGVRQHVERVHRELPAGARIDSFGVLPTLTPEIQLAIMGFKSWRDLIDFLNRVSWLGQFATLNKVCATLQSQVDVSSIGINVSISEIGLSPNLALIPIVVQNIDRDSEFWLDGVTDWIPLLEAIRNVESAVSTKLDELPTSSSISSVFYGRSGRFVLLQGIHHLKLVIRGNQLSSVKAYVYFALSSVGVDDQRFETVVGRRKNQIG